MHQPYTKFPECGSVVSVGFPERLGVGSIDSTPGILEQTRLAESFLEKAINEVHIKLSLLTMKAQPQNTDSYITFHFFYKTKVIRN